MSELELDPNRSFTDAPLTEITAFIQNYYHARLRRDIPKLQALLERLEGEAALPALAEMQTVFAGLSDEIHSHMAKEETVLFPWIACLVNGQRHWGSVQGPVNVMVHEHDSATHALDQLQTLTGGYTVPAGASPTLQALYSGLEGFDAELRRHIDLENLNLFPRALELCP